MERIILTIIVTGLIFSFFVSSALAKLSQEELLVIAQSVFENSVPSSYRNEYSVVSNRSLDFMDGYSFTFQRIVNNIPVTGDKFYVWIDYNGNIIGKGLTYSYPANQLDTKPTLSANQARDLVLKSYGGKIYTEPHLAIRDKDLLWIITLALPHDPTETIPLLEIGIDANTGETKFFNPSQDVNIQQIPTHFTPPWYQPLLINWQYVVVGIIVVGSGLIYFKRKPISNLWKK